MYAREHPGQAIETKSVVEEDPVKKQDLITMSLEVFCHGNRFHRYLSLDEW